ncbi:MAG TPA: response regulator [Pyrinomonadaceae bacterium]|nr:response regulator [Pyrinomonadaceae bacterium]
MDRNKILIIEDDLDLRRGLNLRLRASNYDTAFAADAVMALSIAKKEAPDLILLDLGLPGGDGFLVLERMKSIASLACTPVIVLSARDPKANEKRALDAGADAFFQKPVDNQKLMTAIQRALMK